MDYKFKEVFMSGNIITDKTIRKLDFLRSQQEARILLLGRINPEMFVHLEQRDKAEKELTKVQKELNDLMDEELYEAGDHREESAKETQKENDKIVSKREDLSLELQSKVSALEFINTNIMLIVRMDETYNDCVLAYHDFIEDNFEEFSNLVLDALPSFEGENQLEALETKIKIVEDFFVKCKGNGTR